MASTASLSPLTTLRMPGGRPASIISSASMHRHAGIALRGLQDEGVAAGDRGRELPHRDHRREIERRDAGDDAERLAHRIDVDAGAGAFGVLALHQMRNAAGELDDLEAALDVALGVGNGLAVLARQQLGQLVVVALRPVRGTSSSRGRGAAGWWRPMPAARPRRSPPPRGPRPWRPAPPWPEPRRSSAGRRRPVRPDVPLTSLPPMKCPIVRMRLLLLGAKFGPMLIRLFAPVNKIVERPCTRGGFAKLQARCSLALSECHRRDKKGCRRQCGCD